MEHESRLEEINEIWYDLFGHSYNHCIQLAQIDGEIGQVHKKHIEYMAKQIQIPHESTNGQA